MHFAVLAGGGIPNPRSGGGPLTVYTVIRHALDEGHRVTVIVLQDQISHPISSSGGADDRVDHLRGVGAEVIVVPSLATSTARDAPRNLRARLHRALTPSLHELYRQVADQPRITAAVAKAGCDAAFVYHWESLAASRTVAVPRVVGVGDPSHLPALYRWRDAFPCRSSVRDGLRMQSKLRHQPAAMALMLEECAEYGAFAAHHAQWLREHGASRCRYLHTPVTDEAGPAWAEARRSPDPGSPARFLLLGHLRGIASIDGLRGLSRMLPHLDRALGADSYVVDVVGGYQPPPDLSHVFAHPAVRRHGHTDDPAPWLQGADALLVPVSIPLGIRVRIITGLSFGTPIVAHRANALGIPELDDGENCLLGDTPADLAAAAATIVRDGHLQQRLAHSARATYERSFRPDVAAGEIVRMLEAVAVRR